MVRSIATLRFGVFTFVFLVSFVLLGLCAHIMHLTTELLFGFRFPFTSLGIATSVLAILTLPTMLILDNLRKGAVTSMIVVEISWLGSLWVLFLATAGNASSAARETKDLCSLTSTVDIDFGVNDPTVCREYKAVQALAYLSWLALFFYVLTLSTLSTKLANRGHNRVWYQSVRETDFDSPPVNATIPVQQHIPPQQAGNYYPPQAPA